MTITFVGGGNMATALIGGLIKNGWPATHIRAVEIVPAARDRLQQEFGITATDNLQTGADGADCIVLAVKPQSLRDVARTLAAHVAGKLVISIAAGIRCSDLQRWLGDHARVVRAMPNTPALALAGMTGLYAPADVTTADRAAAAEILGAAGATLWVQSEAEIDAVTAVSGSGPAYVFYFIEALQQAAVAQGFNVDDARKLALETFRGAVKLASESADEPAVLRAKVTSKGGTTERAIATMDAHKLKAIVHDAVQAAAVRSRELGDELGRDA